MKLNYQQIEGALARLEDFQGNTMSAGWVTDEDDFLVYQVKSYDTVIAEVRTMAEKPTLVAVNRWGVTTGRHINLCLRLLPGPFQQCIDGVEAAA